MIISPSRGFVFLHLHKTGGTSFEVGFEPFARWDDLILGSTRMGEQLSLHFKQRFGLYKHSSLAEIEQVCGVDVLADKRVFCFVRHPVSRTVSLFTFVGGVIQAWCKRHAVTQEALRAEWATLRQGSSAAPLAGVTRLHRE